MTAPGGTGGAWRRQVRTLAAARALWGLTCLLRTDDVVRLAGGRPDGPATTFTRVLGVRELVQAAGTGAFPTPGLLRAGAVVDAAHGLSTCVLAVLDGKRARPFLLNALTATGWALLSLRLRRAARRRA